MTSLGGKKVAFAAREGSTEDSFACKHLQVNGESLSLSLLISLMLHQIHTLISLKANKSQCSQAELDNIFQKEMPQFLFKLKIPMKVLIGTISKWSPLLFIV